MLSHTGYANPSISAQAAHKIDLPWPKRTCLDTLRRKLFKNLLADVCTHIIIMSP